MALAFEIAKSDGLGLIEKKLTSLDGVESTSLFSAKLSSDRLASFFKDIWASLAVDKGITSYDSAEIIAWGLQNWSRYTDPDGFALSHPCLVAVQHGTPVLADGEAREQLNEFDVRRHLSETGGVLGSAGARYRTIVELDPQQPVAGVLATDAPRRDSFMAFVRRTLSLLEIGAGANKRWIEESDSKRTLISFLYELHSNGYEHAKRDGSVRLMRLQKHSFDDRDSALTRASCFPELEEYLLRQSLKPSAGRFNIVEASITDFGPGIIDGFLNTFAGRAHTRRSRQELLESLLHERLTSKVSDPNAGLGIKQALEAALEMDAFVSLRTGEFWLTMCGDRDDVPLLNFRRGSFSKVTGTHWQLLLPDRTWEDPMFDFGA